MTFALKGHKIIAWGIALRNDCTTTKSPERAQDMNVYKWPTHGAATTLGNSYLSRRTHGYRLYF